MIGVAQHIMADPEWPSKMYNGLVNPVLAWSNPGFKVKPWSQLINKLIIVCSGMALVLTFGQT